GRPGTNSPGCARNSIARAVRWTGRGPRPNGCARKGRRRWPLSASRPPGNSSGCGPRRRNGSPRSRRPGRRRSHGPNGPSASSTTCWRNGGRPNLPDPNLPDPNLPDPGLPDPGERVPPDGSSSGSGSSVGAQPGVQVHVVAAVVVAAGAAQGALEGEAAFVGDSAGLG